MIFSNSILDCASFVYQLEDHNQQSKKEFEKL